MLTKILLSRIIFNEGHMKKFCLTFFLLLILIFSNILFASKKIIESVNVEEWIVPVYAVKESGGKVPVLKKSDIELFLNGIKTEKFNFLRGNIFTDKKRNRKNHSLQGSEDSKIIILVFDTALSRATSIMKSKMLAEKIISHSRDNTKFLIFKIEPFWGINYIAGPVKKSRRLYKIIRDEISFKDNRRRVNSGVAETAEKNPKYSSGDQSFFLFQQTQYLSYKSSQFALSFRSLYYSISNLIGAKFIYLFSEGISNSSWLPGDTHGGIMAKYLMKSGAVLFFINPSGGKGGSPESGEDFLKGLAEMSGGKYFYGDNKLISREINEVHRSYYEITFQTPPNFRGNSINIEIRSKIPGIRIYTIKNLERSKNYLQLTDIEKKLLVLNIISDSKNFRIPFTTEQITILKKSEFDSSINYSFKIPSHFINRPLDIYSIYTSEKAKRPRIEVSNIKPENDEIDLKMKKIHGFTNNIVVINYETGEALVKEFASKRVKIEKIKYENGILTFSLSNFKRKKLGSKRVSLLKVTITTLTKAGIELSKDSKEITLIHKTGNLRIPLHSFRKKEFYILITVKDLVAGRVVTSTRYIKPEI